MTQGATALAPTTKDSPVVLVDDDMVQVVSADTQAGDVVVELPDAHRIRSVFVSNRVGSGYVEIRAKQLVWPHTDTTVILGPGDRATFHAFGSGWEMV